MSTIIPWIRNLFGDGTSLTRPLTKVAIIGLTEAGQRALLERLSDTPISPVTINGCHAAWQGSSKTLGLALNAVEVGIDGFRNWRVSVASLYTDADALIVVVNILHSIRLEELRCELDSIVNGRWERGEIQTYYIARKGIPWLVLANFEDQMVDEERAKEQVASLGLDGMDLDWSLHPISTATGQGVAESIQCLTQTLELNVKSTKP
ncbi:uncharacterized protein BP01DRAFT_381996 [Aspergillus saccharolyticus JOP 1030-1]|uniref:P-loop containing nucleoside triphosphate hydrolase protein n=1 Tax=Aspergillus saccharolyticus JOP 1030-1 TaxID=1450539 RepID=A0A319A273_9EURO|nr:hypothetical protein BP01DRAFT_381996 [Aspergillus saccharolyticus JOP 1030-1]PYH46368.1 hypothetical protein BP01DRAFT_381996 [Aspergillus saccharolyticus JOP 1030-1]